MGGVLYNQTFPDLLVNNSSCQKDVQCLERLVATLWKTQYFSAHIPISGFHPPSFSTTNLQLQCFSIHCECPTLREGPDAYSPILFLQSTTTFVYYYILFINPCTGVYSCYQLVFYITIEDVQRLSVFHHVFSAILRYRVLESIRPFGSIHILLAWFNIVV